MAKIGCPCGSVISTVTHPCPEERRILTMERVDELLWEPSDNVGEVILRGSTEAYECGECGRILINDGTNNYTFKSYKPE